MPRLKGGLRAFLKNEIRRDRIKVPKTSAREFVLQFHQSSPPPTLAPLGEIAKARLQDMRVETEDNKRNGKSILEVNGEQQFETSAVQEATGADSNAFEEEIDDLFNPLPDSEEILLQKDRIRQAQLEELLSQPTPSFGTTPSLPSHSARNQQLEDLREELIIIVTTDLRMTPREKALMKRQKAALLNEISMLEEEGRQNRVKSLKDGSNLPAPIGPGEKKRLKWERQRTAKAIEGLEKLPKNRQHPSNPLTDLDGEDLFRLRGTHRRPKRGLTTTVTGHWRKDIHDYFPQIEENTIGDVKALSAEARKVHRRELAAMGEWLAGREREMSKEKGMVGRR